MGHGPSLSRLRQPCTGPPLSNPRPISPPSRGRQVSTTVQPVAASRTLFVPRKRAVGRRGIRSNPPAALSAAHVSQRHPSAVSSACQSAPKARSESLVGCQQRIAVAAPRGPPPAWVRRRLEEAAERPAPRRTVPPVTLPLPRGTPPLPPTALLLGAGLPPGPATRARRAAHLPRRRRRRGGMGCVCVWQEAYSQIRQVRVICSLQVISESFGGGGGRRRWSPPPGSPPLPSPREVGDVHRRRARGRDVRHERGRGGSGRDVRFAVTGDAGRRGRG